MKQWWKKLGVFESATVRLTGWYVLLLMALSLMFSLVLFSIASSEFDRALSPRRAGEVRIFIDSPMTEELRMKRISDSTARLARGLVLFNLGVLIGGGALAYMLARRTLQPIRKAHDSQARFASDAAHELRTPLAVIQTEIEVNLRNAAATKAEYAATLRSSLEEVERLKGLTDRLLALASEQELPLGPVNLEEIAVETVSRHVALAQAKNIAVDNRVARIDAVGHAESLMTVIGIVLDNAIKYSPKQSHIRLESEGNDRWVLLRVIDQGPGISKDEQQKIFDRFYRADISRSSEAVPGYGLGLSLAQRLTEGMHGELSVESEVENGATFTIRLPKLVQ